MKAVTIFLTVTILLGICATPIFAAEVELSVDYFWGDGESTSDLIEKGTVETSSETNMIVTPKCTPGPWPWPWPCPDPEPEPCPSIYTPLRQRSDLSGVILGLRYPVGRFRPALEYGAGDEDGDGWREDLRLMELKAGYALSDGEKGRLEPYLGYLDLEAGGFDIAGPMFGLDFRYRLTPRFSLDGGAGYSFDPSLKKGGNSYDDETLSLAKIKLVYHLNERWDLGLGYRVYRFDGDPIEGIAKPDAEYQLTTLGVTVKLGAKSQPEPTPTPEPKIEPTPETPVSEPEPKPEPEPESAPLPVVPTPEVYRALQPIFFDFDKSNLREDQRQILDQNIIILIDHPELYILVGGHADYHGKIDYNVALSKRRAKTVADYMVTKGIDPKRITLYAYGESYPYNNYEANPNWESDRWVDILVSELPPSWEMGIEKRGEAAELK